MTGHAATRPTRSTGWVQVALIALVLIPATAGTLRVVELAGGPQVMPADPRFTASPVPVVVHIVCAVGYAVLGAFQFSAALRRRRPRLAPRRPAGSWWCWAWPWRSRRCG